MRIALYQPEIPGNVGAVLRLAACLGVAVDLIEPLGFAFSERALRRAGMDYAAQASVTRHVDFAAFQAALPGRAVLLTTKGATRLPGFTFRAGDTLLMGSESAGVPESVHDAVGARVAIPMVAGLRSLNIAVASGIALAEALRQTGGWPD